MSAPPKTKPPPPKESDSESDEGSETSDEETEGEEQGEGGSDFESESDQGTDTSKKKPTSIVPSKQQSAVKAPAAGAGIPAKRIREVNGTKEKEDEPLSKKKRLEVAAKSSAVKPTAPLSDTKNKGASKAKSRTSAKETPPKDSTAKDTKKSTKVKLQSSAAKSDASRPSKSNTSEKTPKPSRPWLPEEELALSKEIQRDRAHDAYGAQLPSARADPYWEKLMSRLSFMEKYENEYRVERLCEKVRRMRLRYDTLWTRVKAGETNVWKSDHERNLWRIWHTIWGPLKATPGMLNGDGDEEEEDESEEDEESEEEDEEDDVEPAQAKGRQLSSASASAQKKALSRKGAQLSSDDDDSHKEETSAKVTVPAVLAAPAVPTAEGKQPLASKSVPAKVPAPKAMEMETSQRVVEQNGAQATPAVASVRNVVLSDELRAANLAFICDMRSTCVKLVEEAKTQSLLISERILSDVCAKTAQIVQDATGKTAQIVQDAMGKSSQIMEELRMVIDGLGAIAGQDERMNSSGINYSGNLFQGGSVLQWGNGVIGEQSQLVGRWREQNKVEQEVLLQRLQLVQEQARIQQEDIRLNLRRVHLQEQQQATTQDEA